MGTDPAFADTAQALGEEMARRGIGLVYGGGRLGLMGVVADAVRGAGGEAYGVIPQALIDLEVAHNGLTELHVVGTMHERKALMTELTDAFLCLPGGIGTLDELFEAWSWNALGYHAKPFCLLNVGGFWDNLVELKIGRASCRERVCNLMVFASLKYYYLRVLDAPECCGKAWLHGLLS